MTTGFNPFLPDSELFPEDKETNLFKQKQTYEDIACRVNIREVANYPLREVPIGQRYFPTGSTERRVFRQTYAIPTLTASPGSTSIPHGIATATLMNYSFTRVYGVIQDNTIPRFVPIPNDDVHVEIVATNIVISGYPGTYDGYIGSVVIEYVKS